MVRPPTAVTPCGSIAATTSPTIAAPFPSNVVWRASMYHAAWMGDTGQDNVKAMSGVKAWGAEVVNQVMYDCVQFHGGMGYMRETAIERMSRDARILPIGGGATEVMLEEVAKRMASS